MNSSLKLKAALATLLGLGGPSHPVPEDRPRYPFGMGCRYFDSRKSPSSTKKGPGRRHVNGRRKRGGKA